MRVDPEPFQLSGDERGVLCIHGFTGTPFEVRHLGERLHQRGMTVSGPRLPGHGTEPSALNRTTWMDWFEAVSATFDELRARCERVYVAGQSLGGLLALELAARRGAEVAALAVLGTPLWLSPPSMRAIRFARRFPAFPEIVRSIPKLGGVSDVKARDVRRVNPSYKVLPTRGVLELAAIMERVRGRLAEVDRPLLVLHGAHDHTAPVACSRYLADHVSSTRVRHRVLPESYHLISLDLERDVVAAEVGAFFDSQGDLP